MSTTRPTTIAAYIEAAPAAGQAHLRGLYAVLKRAAPQALETIKWGTPLFVEPRFLFAFSGHQAHCNFAPTPQVLEHFRADLLGHRTTKNVLQIDYDQRLPEALIRRMADYRVAMMREKKGDAFW